MISCARAWFALCMFLLSAPAYAAGVPVEITQRVTEWIAGEWRVPATRLRLEWGYVPEPIGGMADSPLRLVGGGRDGWFAVVVEPPARDPLVLRVRAGVTDTVWVAARALGTGTRIEEKDLVVESLLRWGPPASDSWRPVSGWEVRYPLDVGDPVTRLAVAPPTVVVAGETVRLEWVQGQVRVELDGVALNSAACGGTVRARVSGRSCAIHATVVAPGRAVLSTGID